MLLICLTLLVFIANTVNAVENLNKYQDGNLKFSVNVFKELIKTDSENTLVCPLSVEIVLAMALVGARGVTRQQLAAATYLPSHTDNLKSTFAELLPQLQRNNKYVFELANKIYVQQNFTIREQYRHDVVNDFMSSIENINFKEKDEAVFAINKWVSEETHNTIKDIIKQDDLNEDTRLILLNAMYFKGEWVNGFENKNTKRHPFYINNNTFVNTDMMSVKASFRYFVDLENQVRLLELPYKGDDVTMTIILPNDPESLPTIEQNLEKFITDPIQFIPTTLHLRLPKFKIKSTINFTEILKSLGVILPFENGADFEGMINDDQNEHLKINDVLQKATIEVDEQGTIATAISKVSMHKWKSVKRQIYFYADHPFIFYLKHKVAGIVFIGKYSKPSGSLENENYFQSDSYNQNRKSQNTILFHPMFTVKT